MKAGPSDADKACETAETVESPETALQDAENGRNVTTGCRSISGATSALGRPQRRRTSKTSSASNSTLSDIRFPRIASVVKSKYFEMIIGVVIVINCITMGIEAELLLDKAKGAELVAQVSEHVITTLFCAELGLKLLVFGWRKYLPMPGTIWNFLDALLVVFTGVIPVWIMPILRVTSAGSTLQTLTVLRALRLARLVRVVQKFEAFHEVWLLLRGLMESGRVLFWTVVVIFFITYMFAVFGVVLLSTQIKDEYDDVVGGGAGVSSDLEELADVTGGVFPWMYTLIQVLTLDSWNGIARPMMKYVPGSWAFFYLYIAIAVIVMMNLVTAVIVDNALKNSQKDAQELLKEKAKSKQLELARFRRVFEDMDVDGDGELSWPEFESAFEDKDLSAQLRLLGIEPSNCREIFNMLDTGDGVLSVEEFFQGIACLEGTAQAKELFRTRKTTELLVKLLCQQNLELREDLDELLRVTPGAVVRTRSGSLKHRARRHQQAHDVFLTENSARTQLETSARSGRSGERFSPKAAALEGTARRITEDMPQTDVMKKLDEVVGMVQMYRHECNEMFARCMDKADSSDHRSSSSNEMLTALTEARDLKSYPSVPIQPTLHEMRPEVQVQPAFKEKTPPEVHTPLTTRSNWQMNLQAGRLNLPPAPNFAPAPASSIPATP